jgi:hypothetical protein
MRHDLKARIFWFHTQVVIIGFTKTNWQDSGAGTNRTLVTYSAVAIKAWKGILKSISSPATITDSLIGQSLQILTHHHQKNCASSMPTTSQLRAKIAILAAWRA